MNTRNIVYTGAVAPESLRVTVESGESDLDLTTVTAASLSVRKPDGTTTTWTVAITDQEEGSLVLTHAFSSGDLPDTGGYVVVALLTVPGGTRRCLPQKLLAKSIYEI